MAGVRQDKVQVVLEIEGAQARTELDNLERKQKIINDELKLMKKGTDEYIQKSKELSGVTGQVEALRAKLGIAGMSMQQLGKHSKDLFRELQTLTPGTDSFIKKSAELTKVDARLAEVRKQARGIDSELGKAKGGIGGFVSSVVGMLGPLGATLGATFAVSKVWDWTKAAVAGYNSQQQALAQMEATLNSTQNAAGLTSQELQDMASALQGKTLFPDDETIKAQSLLLTFTNIKKGVYEEAIPAIQDIATKMAGDGPADLKGASIQVGKALNDPIKGITALSKVGVSFTEEQKTTIKTMVEMGDVAGAQKIILAELNKEFGGSAEAARKAGNGGYKAFLITMEDIGDFVGGKLTIGLNKAGNFLDMVMQKSQPVVDIVADVFEELGKTYDQVMEVAEGLGLFSEEGSAAEAVVSALSFVFTILLTPVKVVAQVIGGIVTGFKNLYNSSELVRGSLGGFVAVAVQAFTNLKNIALNTLGGISDLIVGIFTADLDKIKSGLKKSGAALEGMYKGLGDGAGKAFAEGYEKQKDKLIADKKPKPAEVDAAKAAAVAKAEAVVKAESEAAKKAREKADAEAKKLAEQAEKDRLTAAAKILDLELLLIENESDRKIASAKLAADRESKAVVGTTEQKAQQVKLIEQNLNRQIAEIQKQGAAEQEKINQEKTAKAIEEVNRKSSALADMEVLRAGKKGADGQVANQDAFMNALLNQLEVERDIQLQNTQLTAEEKLLLEEEFQQKKLDIQTQFAEAAAEAERGKLTEGIDKMRTATSMFFDFKKLMSGREMSKLDKDKQHRLTALDAEYKAGKISKEQYESSKNAIETNYDSKARAIKRKAAEDEKQAKIADSIMSGILAVIKAAPNVPLQIATGILAALSTAKIIATPLPTFGSGGLWSSIKSGYKSVKRMFASGGAINPTAGVPGVGQLHGNGGIKMLDGASGEYLGEWERGEPYMILSRNTYANNKPVIDALLDSSLYRNGAPIKKNGGIYAANGAVVNGSTGGAAAGSGTDSFDVLVNEVRGMRQDIQSLPRNQRAYVVYSDIEDAGAELEAVRADAAG